MGYRPAETGLNRDPTSELVVHVKRGPLQSHTTVSLSHSFSVPLRPGGVSHSQVRGVCLRTRERPWYV